MSTQYRLVQSGKTASGGCSVGQGSSEPVAPRIIIIIINITTVTLVLLLLLSVKFIINNNTETASYLLVHTA
jgi:hypothetical protein